MFTSDFFFLRPWWLLAIVPALAIVMVVARSASHGENKAWRKLVDPLLLAALTVKAEGSRRTRWYSAALAAGLLAAIIAMAGPTWEKTDVPTVQAKQPTVVVLSLAQSMNTDDVKPSRSARARHKLADILDRMAGGDAGLVIYADQPFVAVPLTGDARVIHEMLPELSTDLMPVPGNRLDLAISEATNLLQQAGAKSGRIVVLASNAGRNADAAANAAATALGEGYAVDAIGIGTPHGTSEQVASGQAIAGNKGKATMSSYDEPALRAITGAGGGTFVKLTADSSDLDRVFPTRPFSGGAGLENTTAMDADIWSDAGYWLLFLPVLLAPLAFRRNALMVLPMLLTVGLIVPTDRAEAAGWSDFWSTPDQQAQTALDDKDYRAAAQLFEDGNWKASALYRTGDYADAAQNFSGEDNASATYNRANALAKAGQLQPALAAYNEQLKKFPNDKDALFNRDLVEKLLQQQKQEQDQNQQQDSKDSQQKDQEQNGEDAQQKQPSESASNDPSQQNQQKQGGANGQTDTGKGQSRQASEDKPQAQNGTDSEQQESAGDGESSTAANSDKQSSQSPATEPPTAEQQQTAQHEASDASEQQQGQATAASQQSAAAKEQQQDQHTAREARNNGAFSEAMDAALRDNEVPDDQQPGSPTTPSAHTRGLSEQQQANEQLLRSVPDDPSGLLRARIYQHYALQRRIN